MEKNLKKNTCTHITELFCYILETILINIFQFFKNLERNKNITKPTKIIYLTLYPQIKIKICHYETICLRSDKLMYDTLILLRLSVIKEET